MDLKKARQEIDQIDDVLVQQFERRLALVKEIAEYKQARQLSIFDADREQEVLARGLEQLENEQLRSYVTEFLQDVMQVSTAYQKSGTMQFLYLVGMPGAGKTTVGRALAESLELEFYDVDYLIQEKAGKSLQNIIIYDGESAFRDIEYEVIKEIITKKPGVIATGGGTVLSEKTTQLMRESGIVIFIHRDVKQILDDLDLEIRPLLKENIEYIFRLYEERCPLYEAVSHIKVTNASSIADAVEQIKTALPKDYVQKQ